MLLKNLREIRRIEIENHDKTLSSLNSEIVSKENQIRHLVAEELQFKINKTIPEIKNVKLIFCSLSSIKYEIDFSILNHDYLLKLAEKYDRTYLKSYTSGHLVMLANSGIMKLYRNNSLNNSGKFIDNEEVLNKLLYFCPELAIYTSRRIKQYENYPIEQDRNNILLILSKWKESNFSVLKEKNIISKICKNIWNYYNLNQK
jgi:hypothetical protein